MIIVRITMAARPEKRKEVMQTLISMIEPTLQEKGCLSYQVFQDIQDKNVFNLIKEWKTREDLDHHLRSGRFGVLLGIKILLNEQQNIQIHTISHSEGIEAVHVVRGKNLIP
jgi:quinol monooxygenase YgiN